MYFPIKLNMKFSICLLVFLIIQANINQSNPKTSLNISKRMSIDSVNNFWRCPLSLSFFNIVSSQTHTPQFVDHLLILRLHQSRKLGLHKYGYILLQMEYLKYQNFSKIYYQLRINSICIRSALSDCTNFKPASHTLFDNC